MSQRVILALIISLLVSSSVFAINFTLINSEISGVLLSSIAWGDYDGDGNMDLCVTGVNDSATISHIYHNDAGVFTLNDAALPGVSSSSAQWIDYDNDGDLDLFIVGRTANLEIIAKLYKNTEGSFVDTNANIMPLTDSSYAWGDFDNDGDLDLIITGLITDFECTTILYLNTPEGFVDSGIQLPGVHSGSVKWGDYDNDGGLDLLITGIAQDGDRITKIFRNDCGVFTDINANLLAVGNSSVAWGDYDNDGLPDIGIREK